jgi:hypothetical protein
MMRSATNKRGVRSTRRRSPFSSFAARSAGVLWGLHACMHACPNGASGVALHASDVAVARRNWTTKTPSGVVVVVITLRSCLIVARARRNIRSSLARSVYSQLGSAWIGSFK